MDRQATEALYPCMSTDLQPLQLPLLDRNPSHGYSQKWRKRGASPDSEHRGQRPEDHVHKRPRRDIVIDPTADSDEDEYASAPLGGARSGDDGLTHVIDSSTGSGSLLNAKDKEVEGNGPSWAPTSPCNFSKSSEKITFSRETEDRLSVQQRQWGLRDASHLHDKQTLSYVHDAYNPPPSNTLIAMTHSSGKGIGERNTGLSQPLSDSKLAVTGPEAQHSQPVKKLIRLVQTFTSLFAPYPSTGNATTESTEAIAATVGDLAADEVPAFPLLPAVHPTTTSVAAASFRPRTQKEQLERAQEIINYTFKDPTHLLEALCGNEEVAVRIIHSQSLNYLTAPITRPLDTRAALSSSRTNFRMFRDSHYPLALVGDKIMDLVMCMQWDRINTTAFVPPSELPITLAAGIDAMRRIRDGVAQSRRAYAHAHANVLSNANLLRVALESGLMDCLIGVKPVHLSDHVSERMGGTLVEAIYCAAYKDGGYSAVEGVMMSLGLEYGGRFRNGGRTIEVFDRQNRNRPRIPVPRSSNQNSRRQRTFPSDIVQRVIARRGHVNNA